MEKITIVLISSMLLTGCASIVSKSNYDVQIQSSPSGAQFTIVNKAGIQLFNGSTPTSVSLPAGSGYFKNESYLITMKMDGYVTKTMTLTSSLDGWYWGNLLIGGIIGMLIVDPATGAMYKLPPSVAIALDEDKSATAPGDVTIISIDSLNDVQRSQLVLLQLK